MKASRKPRGISKAALEKLKLKLEIIALVITIGGSIALAFAKLYTMLVETRKIERPQNSPGNGDQAKRERSNVDSTAHQSPNNGQQGTGNNTSQSPQEKLHNARIMRQIEEAIYSIAYQRYNLARAKDPSLRGFLIIDCKFDQRGNAYGIVVRSSIELQGLIESIKNDVRRLKIQAGIGGISIHREYYLTPHPAQ